MPEKRGGAFAAPQQSRKYNAGLNGDVLKPRVLVLGPVPPPVGGIETVTLAVLESKSMEPFDVRHCDPDKKTKARMGQFRLGNFLSAWRYFRKMRRDLREFKPDVVYMPITSTWSGFLQDAQLSKMAKRMGAKVVGHVHGHHFYTILERKGWQAKVVRKAIDRYDAILMLGERWRRLMESYGAKGHILVVPSTARREIFERGANDAPKSSQGMSAHALFVGQMGKRKGVFDLLEAMHQIKQKGIACKLTLVGPGELEGEYDAVVATANRLALNDVVEFTGPLQGEALYDRFSAADFLVLPSYDEGLPVVLHEAAAFSMTVICTPVGAIPDLLRHEHNSLLVEPGNIEQIASAIERMTLEPENRVKWGTQLKQDDLRYHPDSVTQQIADALRLVLKS